MPERDLDSVAFAASHGRRARIRACWLARNRRARGERLARYLSSITTAKENYAGHDIFTIPVGDGKETRPFRIAQIEYDAIAASNMPTPEQIHSILDRHRAAASPFAGSSLLSARYRDVPAFSSAWAIGHIGLPLSDRGYISILGLRLPLPEDTTFVASLRFLGALHLRIEQIAPTDADAAHAAETLTTLLVVLKSVEHAQMQMHPNTTTDASLLELMNSAKIEQHKDRAVLTANIPLDLVKRLTTPSSEGRP